MPHIALNRQVCETWVEGLRDRTLACVTGADRKQSSNGMHLHHGYHELCLVLDRAPEPEMVPGLGDVSVGRSDT